MKNNPRQNHPGIRGKNTREVLQQHVSDKFAVLGIREESGTFKGERAEGRKCAEEPDEKYGEILLIVLEFQTAQNKAEARDERSRDVHRESPPRKPRQQMVNSTSADISQKSSGKTDRLTDSECVSCTRAKSYKTL